VKPDVWDWLRGCIACGKKHECRDLPGNQVTWVDPDDGHPYRRRTNVDVDQLQVEYEKGKQ
jgi:hypothetical protein